MTDERPTADEAADAVQAAVAGLPDLEAIIAGAAKALEQLGASLGSTIDSLAALRQATAVQPKKRGETVAAMRARVEAEIALRRKGNQAAAQKSAVARRRAAGNGRFTPPVRRDSSSSGGD